VDTPTVEDGYNSGASPVPANPQSAALLVAALVLGLCATRLYSYLLFHTVVELFTVAVAWSIFFLAWNARRFLDNGYLLFVGIAALFVGAIDSVHGLAYKGMGIFGGADGNLPTQLWIAGRYVQSLSFLIAPLFLRRKLKTGLVFGIYTAVTLLLLGSTLHSGTFPVCYVDGAGLTPFKVISEYAVTLALGASALLLFRYRGEFDPTVFGGLAASLFLSMAAELSFTLYVDVYGVANMTGHLLRFLAFCSLYRAILVTGLIRPYDLLFRNLVRSEDALRRANEKLEVTVAALRQGDERYRAFVAHSSEGICRIECRRPIPIALPEDEQVRLLLEAGQIEECNDAYARMYGLSKAEAMIGSRLAGFLPSSEPTGAELAHAFIRSGYRTVEAEFLQTDATGKVRCISSSLNGIVEQGLLVRAWGVQRDITESKRASLERERLIGELQNALAEVKALSGLLPICANCKKIRDDQGYWTQVEAYLQARADVSFSHGICPDCLTALYPEFSGKPPQ
jgi:PAS domain S-box-containing protein